MYIFGGDPQDDGVSAANGCGWTHGGGWELYFAQAMEEGGEASIEVHKLLAPMCRRQVCGPRLRCADDRCVGSIGGL